MVASSPVRSAVQDLTDVLNDMVNAAKDQQDTGKSRPQRFAEARQLLMPDLTRAEAKVNKAMHEDVIRPLLGEGE